ncbi:hypothetical protein LZC95_21220 [Pendulispora brunnea]|uniref:Uncharacterized protein n=1 Tax=Pendulispora brunnea TaxID=2905690 RepID=A0ABZ2KLD3_9BACT
MRAILVVLEQELDAALELNTSWIAIPRLELDLRIDAGDDPRAIADAVGKAIAMEVLLAASQESGPVNGLRRDVRPPMELIRLAQKVRSGRGLGDVDALGTTDDEFDLGNKLIEPAEAWLGLAGAQRVLEALGQLARVGRLGVILAADLSVIVAILERVRGQLGDVGSASCTPADVERVAVRFERAADRALARIGGARDSVGSGGVDVHALRRLLLGIAELSRISPELILASPTTVSALLVLLQRVLLTDARPRGNDGESARSEVAAPLDASRTADSIREAGRPLLPESAMPRDTKTHAPVTAETPFPALDSPVGPISLDEDPLAVEPFIYATRIAGLALFVRPLLDLGMAQALEAIHPEPTFALFEVLRRIALCVLGREPHDEYAIAALAGLLDVPPADELALDAEQWPPAECAAFALAACDQNENDTAAHSRDTACDAWARACVGEVRSRLQEVDPTVDLAHDVLSLEGRLVPTEDALEVHLPFTPAYEPLLRAGLLLDSPYVPWLGRRDLRLVFENRPYGLHEP